MTEKKLTKKEMFMAMLAIKEIAENEEMTKFINHEIELLNRKNGTNRKPTANQLQNEKIKEKILEVLTEPMTATQIMKAVQPYFADVQLTNQRISALLRALGEEKGTGEVTKYSEKRVTYFTKVKIEG